MALLDRGNQSCVVTPKIRGKDDTNSSVWSDGAPVTVSHGMLQKASSAELSPIRGTQIVDLYRWIGRGPWPGGPHSTVACMGLILEQVGNAMVYNSGQNTPHVSVLLKAVITEVL